MLKCTNLVERLELPQAVLSRTDLATLGWQRRAVDAIFRECAKREGVVILPGYRRPMVRVATYRTVIAESTYDNERVWPT
ncbi:MAG: hypothetical protein ACJ752_05105 [Gaiellaceae bacterium]